MKFKNVYLSEEEVRKWAEYFAKKYPTRKVELGQVADWSGMTVNEDQSIFVTKKRVNHDDPDEVELYYFWHGYLFSIEMRQIWGEQDLEAWEFYRSMPKPDSRYERGVHLPIELEHEEEKIFRDFKEAMIVYARDGGKVLNSPIPDIEIRVEGKVY